MSCPDICVGSLHEIHTRVWVSVSDTEKNTETFWFKIWKIQLIFILKQKNKTKADK